MALAAVLLPMMILASFDFGVTWDEKPRHRYGECMLLTVGFLSLAYPTVLWTRSIPIGTRPLLTFGGCSCSSADRSCSRVSWPI